MNTSLKKILLGISVAGFSLTGLPALAADTEEPAPATEHQSETLKKDVEDSAGDTKEEVTGEKGKTDADIPATEHQQETLEGEQDSGDSSKQQMEEPTAPQ